MTSKINHSGDGETVSFAFPFFIPAKTALEVRVGGAIRAEGFNIVGAACPEGGKVVFDAPPATGEQVSLRYRGGVAVTVDDSTFGHLADKLVGGTNVTVTTETLDGGVQKLRIDAAASDLSKSVADGLYLSKTDAGLTYLSKSDAGGTYLSKDAAGLTYLSKDTAGTTYLSKSDAVGTYLSKSDAGGTYLSKDAAGLTYLSKDAAGTTYLSKSDAVGIAYLNVAQDWTKPQRSNALPLNAVGGSVVLDFTQAQNFDLTLNADISFANPVLTGVVGQKGTIGIVPNGHAIAGMDSQWKRVGETGSPSEITGYGRIDYHVRSTSRIEYAYNDVEA